MAVLSKADRDKLDPEMFAFPRTRQCPMHDADHVKMAWDMISNTKGVTDAEKATARKRVMHRAKELGVDTKGWKIQAMSWMTEIEAMSLEVPETPDHPNKAAFTGVLVRLDQPSDAAPHGSFGMRTILTSSAAEAALPSLLGMGVNYQSNLKGHNKTQKIGVIDSATIESDSAGKFVQIGGFLYASDFKSAVSEIRAKKNDLGFSFEAERLFVRDSELPDALEIEKLTFTGAAILFKNSAAYTTTSIAASAEENDDMDEELKKIIEGLPGALKDITGRLEKVEAGQVASIAAASVLDKVKPHSDALRTAAKNMMAAGIGNHASQGHGHILNKMADDMDAAACKGSMPDAYHGAMYASAAIIEKPAIDPAVTELKEMVKNLTTNIETLTAAAAKSKEGAPERKTLPSSITHLMARAGVALPEAGKKLSIPVLDAAMANAKMDTTKRMEVKIALRNAGLLDMESTSVAA